MSGFIKLHRKIQDHWIYQEKRKFSRYEAWLDMIMMANHKPNKFLHGNELVEVERGQFVTSELKLMDRWDWGKNKLRLFLDLLEKDGMIIKKTDRKRTTITICNYGHYHESETKDGPQPDHERTNRGPSADTNKNEKNDKNDKEVIKDIFAFWNSLGIIKHRELTQKIKSKINARLEKMSPEEITESMKNYQTVLNGDLYWWSHKFTLEKFMEPKNIDQFLTDNNPFENFRKQKGGGNGGKYGANYAGTSEASRKAANRGAETFVGTPGREHGGVSVEELRKIASDFE
ncbi:hypothetical protein [Paenibacillus lactis]|uniref:hypothetical protein n=1 Tax=Paenibacillus lactis TaxID=228574 RepID=UPI00367D51EE